MWFVFFFKSLPLLCHSRTLRKKCPYLELFWSAFSCIWTEHGAIQGIFSFRIKSKCGKIRTKITPNTDTFHLVAVTWHISYFNFCFLELNIFRRSGRRQHNPTDVFCYSKKGLEFWTSSLIFYLAFLSWCLLPYLNVL